MKFTQNWKTCLYVDFLHMSNCQDNFSGNLVPWSQNKKEGQQQSFNNSNIEFVCTIIVQENLDKTTLN